MASALRADRVLTGLLWALQDMGATWQRYELPCGHDGVPHRPFRRGLDESRARPPGAGGRLVSRLGPLGAGVDPQGGSHAADQEESGSQVSRAGVGLSAAGRVRRVLWWGGGGSGREDHRYYCQVIKPRVIQANLRRFRRRWLRLGVSLAYRPVCYSVHCASVRQSGTKRTGEGRGQGEGHALDASSCPSA